MDTQTSLSSLFAIGCAISWAIGTFAIGRASIKISSKLLVIIFNVLAGIYFIAISNFNLSHLNTKFVLLGIAAGFAHASALSLVGFALSKGRSGVIAPTSSVFEISIPVIATTIFLTRLGLVTYIGIFILISSVWLLRKADNDSHSTSVFTDIMLGLLVGSGFGLNITFISFVDNIAKDNAYFITQISSIVLLSILIIIKKSKDKNSTLGIKNLANKTIAINSAMFILFELLGIVFLNEALKRGIAVIVAALASIPFTLGIIAISVVLLKEKISKVQLIGIIVASVGIAVTHLSTV